MAERKRKLGFGQSARSTKATSFTKTSTASATASKAAADAGDGIRNIRTTSLFRAVNFELFIKPNKVVMAFGLVSITGCVAYIAYMNAMAENRKDQIYVAYNADGTTETKRQKSKWD